MKHISAYRWSFHLLDALAQAGVRHVVISPGSRSAPLTIAAADHPALETTLILDERSAGFFALGIGKYSAVPAALICTSGTAVANYLPSVVEARQSGVPMVVLSADRPPGLRGNGASQTIDQIKVFGDHAVWFHEAGEPAGSISFSPLPAGEVNDLERLQLAGFQAVQAAILRGGASHINLPFRKPLEPELPERAEVRKQWQERNPGEEPATERYPADQRTTGRPSADWLPTSEDWVNSTHIHPDQMHVDLPARVTTLLNASKRPLCIAGPAHPHTYFPEAIHIASQLRAPLLAEPGSLLDAPSNSSDHDPSATFIRHADAILSSGLLTDPINPSTKPNLTPDLILLFGHRPVSKSLLTALQHWAEIPLIHIVREGDGLDLPFSTSYGVRIPANATISGIRNPGEATISGVRNPGEATVSERGFRVDGSANQPESTKWLAWWNALDREAAEQIARTLDSAESLTDPHVYHQIPRQLQGYGLMVSNSFPVRDMGLFGQIDGGGRSLLFVNRGAAGIDGILSTAAGLARASAKKWACFIGDLAFLHDSNALMTLRNLQLPMIVFVVNNGGGTIFRMLPVAKQTDLYETYFETPQQVSIEQLATAHGLKFERIETRKQLEKWRAPELLDAPLIVECVTSADESMNVRDAVKRLELHLEKGSGNPTKSSQ